MHRVDEGVSPLATDEAFVLGVLRRAPRLVRLVLVSIRARGADHGFVIAIVGVRHAKRVGRRRLGGVAQTALAVDRGRAPLLAVIPHDEVDAAPRRDRVGAVAAAAEVQERTARHVGIAVGERAMVGVAHVAAKGEPSAGEILAETDVQGHIAVIRMHVEIRILLGRVGDDKTVVIVESRRLAREERLRQRVHAHLEGVEARPQPDIVQDEPILVHGVWAPRLEATLAEILDLLDEPLRRGRREHRERVDLARLLPHQRPRRARVARHRRRQREEFWR